MVVVAIIWGFIVGSTTQFQLKYDHCKESEFKTEYCKLPKELSKLDNK